MVYHRDCGYRGVVVVVVGVIVALGSRFDMVDPIVDCFETSWSGSGYW